MKKIKFIFSLILVMMFFPFAVYANEIGDFYQDIILKNISHLFLNYLIYTNIFTEK